MLNITSRQSLIVAWFILLAIIVTFSILAGAGLATLALLLVVGVSPVLVMMRLAGTPKPTVAEILHTAETGDRRR
jgi:hypothetical protein